MQISARRKSAFPRSESGVQSAECRSGNRGRLAMTSTEMKHSGAPDLGVSFCGIKLKNPVIAASGTFGYGIEFEDVVHLDKLGGFVAKGLSAEPMAGNPPPRLYETPAGMLNAIGLQNIGARAFIEEKLPKLRKMKNIVVFANVFGYSREDYERTIEILNEAEDIAARRLVPPHSAGGWTIRAESERIPESPSDLQRQSMAQRDGRGSLQPAKRAGRHRTDKDGPAA